MAETNMESPSVALVVEYDGAPFAGFARQPGLATVQGRLEDALAVVLRSPVVTTGAGRTDSGVHAFGQVVSFDPGSDIDARQLRRSLNALVGDGIVVRDVRIAKPGFSARFDAVSREYRYRLVTGETPPLFLQRYAWHVRGELDVPAMAQGARYLLGEHDFKSFCVTESAAGQRTVRRVDEVRLIEEQHLGERCDTVIVKGNAFLHSMVRTIVGTLVEVGTGRKQPDWVAEVLRATERATAGPTAPARGLTFWAVEYPDDVWL